MLDAERKQDNPGEEEDAGVELEKMIQNRLANIYLCNHK